MNSNEFNDSNDLNDYAEASISCLSPCNLNLNLQPHLSEPVWEKAVSELPETGGPEMVDLSSRLFLTKRALLLRNWTTKGARGPFFLNIKTASLTRKLILVQDDKVFQFTDTRKLLSKLESEGAIQMKSLGSLFFPGNDGDVVITTYTKFYHYLATNTMSVFGLWPDILTFCYDSQGISPEAVAVIRMLAFDSVMTKVIFSSPVEIISLPESFRNASNDGLALSEKRDITKVASRIEYYYENLTEELAGEKTCEFYVSSQGHSATSLLYCKDQSQALRMSAYFANKLPDVRCFGLTKSSDMTYVIACENELRSLSSWILILDDTCRGYSEFPASSVVDMGEIEAGTAYFGWKKLYRTLHEYEFVTSKQIYATDWPPDVSTKVYLAKIGLNVKSLPKYISGKATELMNQLGYHYGND